jgi:2-polyprenyl-6-methoxyphenol hydroxylase-like FAD-dependent oxidoreductase
MIPLQHKKCCSPDKLIAKLDAALLRDITDGKYMGLMHWTLEEALYEALADQVEVRFDRSLTHIVPGPDAVVVTFNDGTTESFDLLIGADGVHSSLRSSNTSLHRNSGGYRCSWNLSARRLLPSNSWP